MKAAEENATIEERQPDADRPGSIGPPPKIRILTICPRTRDVSERVVPGSEIYSIVGSTSLACTPLPRRDEGINFVLEKYLARTYDRFTLFSKEHVFTGRGIICGSESEFSPVFSDTTISVSDIYAVVNFFTAPRPLFGWLK
jgi:hypothetical protein